MYNNIIIIIEIGAFKLIYKNKNFCYLDPQLKKHKVKIENEK